MSNLLDRLFVADQQRQEKLARTRSRSWDRKGPDSTGTRSSELPDEPGADARGRRIRTVAAFLDALFELREAASDEPSAPSGLGRALNAPGADDGRIWAAAHVRLPIETLAFLEQLETVWAALGPHERRVLTLQRDGLVYEAIAATLRREGVRTAAGEVTRRYVLQRVKVAHRTIEQHEVFRRLRGDA